jgi:hypothetical protein
MPLYVLCPIYITGCRQYVLSEYNTRLGIKTLLYICLLILFSYYISVF